MRVAAGAAIAVTALTARGTPARADGGDLVLARGEVVTQVAIEADLATFAKPLSIAPDAWVGATSRLTVGFTDSDGALDLVDDGASACLRGGLFGCTHHGSGVDARYLAADWIAPRVRVLARELSPWKPALTLGALVRVWRRGRFEVTADPYVQLGLANTDLGNGAAIVAPIYATLALPPRFSLSVETGYVANVAVWSDGYHVPLAATVDARVAPHVALAVEAGLTSLAGPQNNVKQREAWLIARLDW